MTEKKLGIEIMKKRDLEKIEKKKEMEKFISDCFENISKSSNLKDQNSVPLEKRLDFTVYNFDECMRGEFILFALSYGLYFETIEAFWREIIKGFYK